MCTNNIVVRTGIQCQCGIVHVHVRAMLDEAKRLLMQSNNDISLIIGNALLTIVGTQRLTVVDPVLIKKPQRRYELIRPSDQTALCTHVDAMAVVLDDLVLLF